MWQNSTKSSPECSTTAYWFWSTILKHRVTSSTLWLPRCSIISMPTHRIIYKTSKLVPIFTDSRYYIPDLLSRMKKFHVRVKTELRTMGENLEKDYKTSYDKWVTFESFMRMRTITKLTTFRCIFQNGYQYFIGLYAVFKRCSQRINMQWYGPNRC